MTFPSRPGSSSVLSNRQLQRAVSNRALIEQAKGALVLRYRIDSDQAFEILRSWAQETNSTVLMVAETLICAVCQGDESHHWDRTVRAHVAAALEEPLPAPPATGQRRIPRPRLRTAG